MEAAEAILLEKYGGQFPVGLNWAHFGAKRRREKAVPDR